MTAPFDQKAAGVVARLIKDFRLTDIQAAGIVGNLGAESGLRAINEGNPTVPGSRGGFGWAQWTGPRRVQFEQWCASHKLPQTSDDANYGFLRHELEGPYSHAITQLRKTTTIEAATETFEAFYEKAGVKRMGARYSFAKQALALYRSTRPDPLPEPLKPVPRQPVPPIAKPSTGSQVAAGGLAALIAAAIAYFFGG